MNNDEVGLSGDAGQAGNTVDSADDLEAVRKLKDGHNRIRTELARVIVGQDDVLDQLVVAILSNGHVILEGAPAPGPRRAECSPVQRARA